MRVQKMFSMKNKMFSKEKARVTLIAIGIVAFMLNNALAHDVAIKFIPDCDVKSRKGVVDINILISPPHSKTKRILNLLCPDLLKSKRCSAVLLDPDFAKRGTFYDTEFNHIKEVEVAKTSPDSTRVIWNNNELEINMSDNMVYWKSNGRLSAASCTEVTLID